MQLNTSIYWTIRNKLKCERVLSPFPLVKDNIYLEIIDILNIYLAILVWEIVCSVNLPSICSYFVVLYYTSWHWTVVNFTESLHWFSMYTFTSLWTLMGLQCVMFIVIRGHINYLFTRRGSWGVFFSAPINSRLHFLHLAQHTHFSGFLWGLVWLFHLLVLSWFTLLRRWSLLKSAF